MVMKKKFIQFLGSGDYSTLPPFQEAAIPVGAIIGAIVAILLLGFILVDLTCFKINQTGITYMVCRRARKKHSRINKNNKRQRWEFILSYFVMYVMEL